MVQREARDCLDDRDMTREEWPDPVQLDPAYNLIGSMLGRIYVESVFQ